MLISPPPCCQPPTDWAGMDVPQVDYLGEPTAGNLQLTQRAQHDSVMQLLGLADINDIFSASIQQLQTATRALLDELGVPSSDTPEDRPERAVFCSRTLNFRAIQAIGYDLDYTLVCAAAACPCAA